MRRHASNRALASAVEVAFTFLHLSLQTYCRLQDLRLDMISELVALPFSTILLQQYQHLLGVSLMGWCTELQSWEVY